MTNKFQSYVDNIQEKNKFKLLLIPILVVTFIIVLNQLLIIPLIFKFKRGFILYWNFKFSG